MTPVESVEIRHATSSQAVAMTALVRELGYPTAPAAFSGRLDTWLRHDECLVLVAQDADFELLGWIGARRSVSLLTGGNVEIEALIVAKKVRRCGVGRQLVDAVKRWSRDAGVGTIIARSNVKRSASHKFYDNLDFEKTKSQHVYRHHVTRKDVG